MRLLVDILIFLHNNMLSTVSKVLAVQAIDCVRVHYTSTTGVYHQNERTCQIRTSQRPCPSQLGQGEGQEQLQGQGQAQAQELE